MFERLVTKLLNKYLGQYVQDLDSEKLDIGFLNGKIELFNLKLKPEALAYLNLPIEVKTGTLGYIKIVIPWKNFNEKPLIITVDHVLVIVGPVKNRAYNEELDLRLQNAKKQHILNSVDNFPISPSECKEKLGILEKILFAAVDNIQVFITNIHICYQDSGEFTKQPGFVFGVLLHSANVETTNHKWRSGHVDINQNSIFKLVKLESLSVYWNPTFTPKQNNGQFIDDKWKSMLIKSLETFTIAGEECNFLLRPVSAKVKAIISKSKEKKPLKLLVDLLLHDLSAQMTYHQYVSISSFMESVNYMEASLPYKRFHPNVKLKGNAKRWWKYAINSVIHVIRTFSWKSIHAHRHVYRKYRDLFCQMLTHSSKITKTELLLLENDLNVTCITLAREEAKIMCLKNDRELGISFNRRKIWQHFKFGSKFNASLDSDETRNVDEVDKDVTSQKWDDIENQIIFTVANCSFSLINSSGQEIIVVTLTQFLTNLDTCSGKVRSFSLRLESFLIEGATFEQELIPVVHLNNFFNGSSSPYVFALDFGARYPQKLNSDYVVNVASEQFEVIYQHSTYTEMKSFFEQWPLHSSLYDLIIKYFNKLVEDYGNNIFSYLAVPQYKKIHISCYLKCPTIIFPEDGTFQTDGNILIVDFGHLTIQSVLHSKMSFNAIDIEDVLKCHPSKLHNLEVLFNDVQILFVDSGDEWRMGRLLPDTDFHLIPKVHAQIICSGLGLQDDKNSRKKINAALPSFKINLSDRRLKQLSKYLKRGPLLGMFASESKITEKIKKPDVLWEPTSLHLKSITAWLSRLMDESFDLPIPNTDEQGNQKFAQTVENESEIKKKSVKSDSPADTKDQWARTIDLPGFDDNVSPTNVIKTSFGLIIGEVVIHVARSNDHVDKPYLMLRIEKLCFDLALMTYGPAMQLSAECIQLVDKLHIGLNGQYLELLTSETTANENVIIILYRKVSSDCPEFKSHFHSVEQSLVVTVEQLKTNFHHGAIITVQKYLEYMADGLNLREAKKHPTIDVINQTDPSLILSKTWLNRLFLASISAAPVPPGAIKYSFSFRLDKLGVRLCDSDVQLAELEIARFETDYIQKANERKVIHLYLQYVAVNDLSDTSLYSKIIAPEEDKVFELKFVQNCEVPCQHAIYEDTTKKKCDMNLKVQVRRLRCCLISKFFTDIKDFSESFLQYQMVQIHNKLKDINKNLKSLIKCGSVVNLSVDIQAPVIVMPHKQDSPNAVVFQLGDIGLENFVKVIGDQNSSNYADNIIIRWNNLQMSRVVIMDDGSFDESELIVDQAAIRLDVVREFSQLSREHKISVSGVMDTIKINIEKRDLALFLAIYKEMTFNDEQGEILSTSDVVSPPINYLATDVVGKKLQAFFNTSIDVIKETSFHFTLEGAEIVFGNERPKDNMSNDCRCGLSVIVLQMDEVNIDADIFNNGLLKMKCTFQSICLEDISHEESFAATKIFHYYNDDQLLTDSQTPPIISVSYKQEPSGDVQVNTVMEKTRLNLSIAYLLTLTEFVHHVWMFDQSSANEIDESSLQGKSLSKIIMMLAEQVVKNSKQQLSKSSSSYSYPSTSFSVQEEKCKFTITATFKEPEIVFHIDHASPNSQALVLKMNVEAHKVYSADSESVSLAITGLKLGSFSSSKRHHPVMILHPCNIEFSKILSTADLLNNIVLKISPIDFRISPTLIQIINGIGNELKDMFKHSFRSERSKTIRQSEGKDMKDLWEIKKVTPIKCDYLKEENSEMKIYQKKHNEIFAANLESIQITCELDYPEGRLPLFTSKLQLDIDARDWSRQMYLKGELKLEASCYNSETLTWEALLEPVLVTEENYRPFEVLFKIFRQAACPVICSDVDYLISTGSHLATRTQAISESSSDNDTNSDDAMTIIRKPSLNKIKIISRHKEYIRSTIDSGSDNESESMTKLASAFSHMFSSDSSDDQLSECDGHLEQNSSVSADDDDSDSNHDENISARSSSTTVENKNVLSRQRSNDSVDSGVEDTSSNLATYVLINAKDKLNLTFSPTTFQVISEIIEAINCKPHLHTNNGYSSSPLQLLNRIGITSSVTIFQNHEENDGHIVTVVTDKDSDFHLSPVSTAPEIDLSPTDVFFNDDKDEGHYSFPSNCASKLNSEETSAFNYNEEDVESFYHRMAKEKIQIEVEGFENFQCHIPDRSSTRIYALQPQKNSTIYHVSVNVDMHRGYKSVMVSSPLQIQNCLEQAVHLYYVKGILENLEISPISHLKNPFGEYIWLATIQPDDICHVPLFVAYHCHIFFQPAYLSYQVSENAVWWQDLASSPTLATFIICPSKSEGKTGYTFKACCKEIEANSVAGGLGRLFPNYKISLHPAVTIHNCLPVAITLNSNSLEKDIKLEPGSSVAVVVINLVNGQRINIEMTNYNGVSWKGAVDIHEGMDHNKTICMMADYVTCVKQYRQLYLDSKVVHTETMNVYIYAPYWIVNKTNLPLQFRGSGSTIIYESNVTEDPVLFRFKHHRRRRLKTRVYNSRWSVSYSIDNIGNSGLVMCKDTERNKKYKFLLSITLSKTLMSKIITLKPYFIVVNHSKYHLRFLERNDKTDLWMDIGPHDSVSFWPDTNNMQMHVKMRDSKIVSQPFFINRTDNTVLRMDHGTALCVNVYGGQESPWMIIFKPYTLGSAPVKVENHCDDIFLKIYQKSMCQVTLLSPYESILYTWDDPTKERTIFWNICNRKKSGFPGYITKDGCGHETVSFHSIRSNVNRNASISNRRKKSFHRVNQSSSDDDSDIPEKNPQQKINKKIRRDKVVVHWVSYMEQNQRVLLFTQDDNVARLAKQRINGSHACLEWCLSLNEIGVSLVNNYKEIAYISLSSAPSVWDVEINHKWKTLPLELSAWLEIEWKKDQVKAEMTDYVQVDFGKMQMTKPFFGRIRRRFFPGFWSQYRCSEFLSFVHFKFQRLQIDNQMYGTDKPTILHPAPAAPQIASKFGFRPFIEICLVQRHDPKETIKIIKYCKILIQEFNVNLDTDILEALSQAFKAMLSKKEKARDGKNQLHKDLLLVQAPVVSSKSIMHLDGLKTCMFEYIHISPIKINFNFSPQRTFYPPKPSLCEPKSNLFDYIMSSTGSSLNEIKDVQLKLIYFERKGVKCSHKLMLSQITNHYFCQSLMQAYVYIVGVDVLGNPYMFPRDFTHDLGDQYYEPSLGIVQMAEEYAESAAIEIGRLLGHYVSRSRKPSYLLSGNLEQAASFLSFNEDYKKKRLKEEKSSFPDSLSIASKSFSVGVFMGISGVNVKPLHGVHQKGIEGYLKGIGKGLLAIISKPMETTDDMVAAAFDGIRRAQEMGEDLTCRMRLPRFISTREGVKPYSSYKSAGQRLVWKLAKGHYAESDTYWAHTAMRMNERTSVILMTDRHIFELVRNRIWTDWTILRKINVDDIMAIPTIISNRMVIKMRQDKSADLFPGNEYCIVCDDVKVLHWLKKKVEMVLIAHMEDRPCPIVE
ncbi:hypothetical protein CHUAL_010881 [Chamberlinius hualienensis]